MKPDLYSALLACILAQMMQLVKVETLYNFQLISSWKCH